MEAQELTDLLDECTTDVQATLKNLPPVLEVDDPNADDIPGQGSQKWLKIPKVFAVVADLKNSTQLGTGRHDTSTARAYKSAVEGSVKILNKFEADFIDIQGDGGFGLFWGDKAIARAMCAGVTIRTFSQTLVEKLEAQWAPSGGPETGLPTVQKAADVEVLIRHRVDMGVPQLQIELRIPASRHLRGSGREAMPDETEQQLRAGRRGLLNRVLGSSLQFLHRRVQQRLTAGNHPPIRGRRQHGREPNGGIVSERQLRLPGRAITGPHHQRYP